MLQKPLLATTVLLLGDWEGIPKMFTDIALVIFTAVLACATIVLAWATIKLAKYTQALSQLTERLVKIETQRDERELKENRRKELLTALLAAETVQKIYPENFAQHLNKPADLPLEQMKAIEILHSLKRYMEDPDCHQHLEFLCNTFDSMRREKSQLRINEQEVATRVRNLQNRIQWFLNKARTEISS